MYETFDHTADLGLRVRAAGLDQLFTEAAEALSTVLVENLDAVRPKETMSFTLEAAKLDDLLHDWLGELLYVFDTRQLIFSRFAVQLRGTRLTATATGERLDTARHRTSREVKAITYHGLRVEQQDQGWLAEVIVDI